MTIKRRNQSDPMTVSGCAQLWIKLVIILGRNSTTYFNLLADDTEGEI